MPPDTPSGHPQSETSRAAVASFHRRGERAGCRRSACHQSTSAPGESYVRCVLPPSAGPAPRRLKRPVVRVSQSSRISFLWTIDQVPAYRAQWACCASRHDSIEGAVIVRSASSGLKVAAFTSARFSLPRGRSRRLVAPDRRMGLLGLDDRAHPGRRPRPVNALVYPLYCSRWRGLTTCSSPNGYVSHETQWQGRTNGWDNRGDTWSTRLRAEFCTDT